MSQLNEELPILFTRAALRIALVYVILSGFWIVFSDQVTHVLFSGTPWLTPAQTVKGWCFVLLTGGLLYILMVRTLRQIEVLALEDSLVELPNRFGFLATLGERCRNRAMRNKPFALCIMDLDNFSDVNDLHGHNHGDELLLSISRQLRHELDENWYVARIGGDEFALLSPPGLEQCERKASAEKPTA